MKKMSRWLAGEWARLGGVWHGSERQARFEAEAQFHLEMLTQRYLREGCDAAEARRRARVDFGGIDRFRESARDEYRSRPVEEFVRDVRLALRNLSRAPVFTAAAVTTLGLGIGATTVVYSVVDHVVLRPLPYPDVDRLVVVREIIEEIRAEVPSVGVRAEHYLDWRARCGVCDDVAALLPTQATLHGAGEPARLTGVSISANLLPMLGAQPLHGRHFLEEEDAPERGDVVILGHSFWQRHLAGDPAVVGTTIRLGTVDRLVVGVLPPRFRLPKGHELNMPVDPDVYLPLALTQELIERGGSWDYTVLARLVPGATRAQAESHITAMQRAIAAGWPQPVGLSALVLPLQDQVVGASGRGLLLLLGAVGAVLLLVCVNLANLLLARTAARAREAAVRAALGAGRVRLVREALTESLILAVAAGVIGIALSQWGLQLLLQLAPADMPRLHEVRLDTRVAGVAVLLSLFTGILFGALPALRVAGADPGDALKAGGRLQGDDRSRTRARTALVALQVGMTAVLLVAAGLFLTSFIRVMDIDRGFTAQRVLAVDVLIPRTDYASGEELLALYDRMLHELAATPGIESAAATSKLPLEGVTWLDNIAERGDTRGAAERPSVNLHRVTNDYFRTLGIPLRAGAAFTEAHRGRNVVVLSQRAAAVIWPGDAPAAAVGRAVQIGGHFAAEVLGVTADVASTGLETERSPLIYLPTWTPIGFSNAAHIAVRTAMEPALAVGPTRQALRRAVPGVVISAERTMDQLVSEAAAARRFQMSLLLLFGLTALVTACVGIYGVIAHSLARRRGEIGVRMALGARRGTIHRLVLGEGMRAAAAGLAGGLVVVALFGRFIESQLYEIRAVEPVVLGVVAATLGAIVAAACWIPARRATAGDVAVTLRQE